MVRINWHAQKARTSSARISRRFEGQRNELSARALLAPESKVLENLTICTFNEWEYSALLAIFTFSSDLQTVEMKWSG